MWICIGILLLVILVVSVCTCLRVRETFTTKPRTINAACLYAAFDITDEDVKFILKYANDIPFYIVNNGELSVAADKLKDKKNISIVTRENEGYDVGAWKYGMRYYADQLSKYDLIIFMNNSCVIGADLLRLCEHAIDYDLYSFGFSYELYKQPFEHPHLHAYMFFVNKRLFDSPDFKNHWENIHENSGNHDESVNNNEYKLKSYFESKGYKVGAYVFFDVDDTYKHATTNNYSSEIIKKRELKVYPDKLQSFNDGISNNHKRGY